MTFDQIIPLLVYEDIPAAHDFLVRAFGFAPVEIIRDDAGQAIPAEVRASDMPIWLHQVSAHRDFVSPRRAALAVSGLVVLVDDVDAHYEHARSAGARIEDPPQDKPYGQREYGARDIEGHWWWFATRP